MRTRIMVVDDEESLVKLIAHNLQREGYEVIPVRDGLEALARARSEAPDLIILDVMLPGLDGLEVCRRLRQDKVDIPVIMLTARDEEIDRVLGLEIGADDYVTKPFSVRELLARVKAVLRRRAPVPEEVAAPLRVGSLELRPDSFEAFVDGHPVSLTLKEFELLEMLARNRGRVLKRDYLLQALWGFDSSASTRVLDVHISKLREKLGDDSTAPRFIKTVRGVGYRLEESKDVQ